MATIKITYMITPAAQREALRQGVQTSLLQTMTIHPDWMASTGLVTRVPRSTWEKAAKIACINEAGDAAIDVFIRTPLGIIDGYALNQRAEAEATFSHILGMDHIKPTVDELLDTCIEYRDRLAKAKEALLASARRHRGEPHP